MAVKIVDTGAPCISAIERPRKSTLSALVRDKRLDRILQANEELDHKVDELATELSALKELIFLHGQMAHSPTTQCDSCGVRLSAACNGPRLSGCHRAENQFGPPVPDLKQLQLWATWRMAEHRAIRSSTAEDCTALRWLDTLCGWTSTQTSDKSEGGRDLGYHV
ncbi:hypothetical protein MRX96_000160 [Rhipicephalus microplus]